MDSDGMLLDHTADLAMQVESSNLKNLFENAGIAPIRLLVGCTPSAEPSSTEIP